MPEPPDPLAPRPYATGGFSRWQYHQDQLRRQWALHLHLNTCIKSLQHEADAILAPAETLTNEIMCQVLARYNWEPLPSDGPRLVKSPEVPQRLTA
jgi:hypothetical protein